MVRGASWPKDDLEEPLPDHSGGLCVGDLTFDRQTAADQAKTCDRCPLAARCQWRAWPDDDCGHTWRTPTGRCRVCSSDKSIDKLLQRKAS